MQRKRTQARRDAVTVVARGYGVQIKVSNGHLVIDDGFGQLRRTQRLHRTDKLDRLVIVGRSGYVSLDALRWLHDTGTAFLHVDTNGDLIAPAIAAGPDFAALRRAQALAAGSPVGLQIARGILMSKVQGQQALLAELPGGAQARDPVEWAVREIESATNLDALLTAEAQAAAAYRGSWRLLPVRFARGDARKVPEHWTMFGQRASLITGGPRVATNPANAVLNYLYSLLEAETTFACHAVGLDPGIGTFHTDQRDRASLALDIMEAARPAVDAYVLALLTQRVFSAREFLETTEGGCRIHPRLAEELAGTCEVWRSHIGPVAERVAHTLVEYSPSKLPTLTPLTRSNWKRAWDERAPDRKRRRSRSEFAQLPSNCRDCGASLPDRRRRYCDNCRAERFNSRALAGRQRAAEVLAQLRSEQRDPAHGGRAAENRGRKNAAHQAAVRDWRGERPDPEVFRTEILPGLRRVPIGELVAATGLSDHYCSLIRLGKKTPHPRHWDALRDVSGDASRSIIPTAATRAERSSAAATSP
jgi:CRISPR-associated protein Cas1